MIRARTERVPQLCPFCGDIGGSRLHRVEADPVKRFSAFLMVDGDSGGMIEAKGGTFADVTKGTYEVV